MYVEVRPCRLDREVPAPNSFEIASPRHMQMPNENGSRCVPGLRLLFVVLLMFLPAAGMAAQDGTATRPPNIR